METGSVPVFPPVPPDSYGAFEAKSVGISVSTEKRQQEDGQSDSPVWFGQTTTVAT